LARETGLVLGKVTFKVRSRAIVLAESLIFAGRVSVSYHTLWRFDASCVRWRTDGRRATRYCFGVREEASLLSGATGWDEDVACLDAAKRSVPEHLAPDGASGSATNPKGNNMSKLIMALGVCAALGIAGPVSAQMQSPTTVLTPMSKDAYAAAKKDADAQYKIDKETCASMSGNAKDICSAQAKGRESMAKADASAAYESTPKARENARVAHAKAGYSVALERCDDFAGNRKDVCVKEAKADLVKGTADAKVDRVVADTRNVASEKRTEAREEASADKRDAEFKVALEKCNALAGPAKESCVGDAKVRFGKS
jgi:hypothetical protein